MRSSLRIAFIMLLTAPELFAKVAPIPFGDLVASCESIVVAQVESVSSPVAGRRYAEARVMEVWKGPETATVKFLASPTWACDISEAKEGETVLLFLAKDEKSQSYAIAHSGHGRWPLRTIAGKSHAVIGPLVILPKDTPMGKVPEPKNNFIRSVEIRTLQELVTRVAQEADGTK